MSNSLWPHEPQHTRPPCPLPTAGVYPNPCPLSRWCHPPISSSVVPFSSCPQSFPASGSFQASQLFVSGGQRIGVSASASVLPMNTHSGLISFRMDWLGLLEVQGTVKSDYVDHNKLWKILKEMGIPDHLTCLLRNLYAGQEAIVRTGHGTTDWLQIGKGVHQDFILSPCLFNVYA